MPTTWTPLTSTGGWDSLPPTAFSLTTESDLVLHTEDDLALIVDFTVTAWSSQSNSAATWTAS